MNRSFFFITQGVDELARSTHSPSVVANFTVDNVADSTANVDTPSASVETTLKCPVTPLAITFPPSPTTTSTLTSPLPTSICKMSFEDAFKCVQRSCQTDIIIMHNTMWLMVLPCICNENNKLIIAIPDCNWNNLNSKTGLEIAYNIHDNPIGRVRQHDPTAGNDMGVLLIHKTKVNLCS